MNADTADPEATTPGTAGPPTDRLLELAWRYHRQWSLAADAAKKRLDGWRKRNLALLITGALAGAVATQTWPGAVLSSGPSSPYTARLVLCA